MVAIARPLPAAPPGSTRLLMMLANALIGLVMLSCVGACGWWISQRPMFALDDISIAAAPGHPLRHISEENLTLWGARSVEGNFFTVDLQAVRKRFEQLPWVRRAYVRRIWPNALQVELEEHRPYALWNDGRLVNHHGELFAANLDEAEEDGSLPEFTGPPGSEKLLMQRFRELIERLEPVALKPVALNLSARYAWSAELETGMTLLLGRDQGVPIPERVDKFVAAWPKLLERIGHYKGPVDLRYANGFAIRYGLVDEQLRTSPDASTDEVIALNRRAAQAGANRAIHGGARGGDRPSNRNTSPTALRVRP